LRRSSGCARYRNARGTLHWFLWQCKRRHKQAECKRSEQTGRSWAVQWHTLIVPGRGMNCRRAFLSDVRNVNSTLG
jgi:hypothetical protein